MTSTQRKLSVFVDANILVSGLFYKGPENTLLRLGILGLIELVTCGHVIMEVEEVVKRKFPESSQDVKKILYALKITETETKGEARKLIRDKKDAPILASALRYKPDYLITGDKDFHTPEIKKKINTATTSQFLKEYLKNRQKTFS